MVVMKTSEQTKPRADSSKKNGGKAKALLVAQEISFAKVLAGNDKRLRDRGVKRLRKWLNARSSSESALEKDDFMRLWKGLFYCMWMADKPLVQEELAETISSLVHSFTLPSLAINFIEGFFRSMSLEWQGIDQHRLEKFLMFVRRFLRQSLALVAGHNWDLQLTDSLCKTFESTLLPDHANLAKSRAPLGLVMHFTDIFLEELAKVSKGKLNEDVLLRFLKSFAQHIAAVRDARIRSHIIRQIFIKLIEQSPVGLEFQEKYRAWKALGFPGGSIDVMERADDEDTDDKDGGDDKSEDGDESDEGSENMEDSVNGDDPLDPRAGGVHVELPIICFEAASVAKLLEEFRFKKYSNNKTRKHIGDIVNKFEELAKGQCPIGMKKVPEAPELKLKQLAQEAAEDLMHFESELLEKDDDSEDESLDESFETMGDSDDDAPKENLLKRTKEGAKRKTSEPEKKISKKKKALLEQQNEEKSNEDSPNVAKKKQAGKTKLKSKSGFEVETTDTNKISVADSKLQDKQEFVVTNMDSAAATKLVDSVQIPDGAESNGPPDSSQKKGTGALLQHIAPHLTGTNKSKRRNSCGPKFLVTDESGKEISGNLPATINQANLTGALLQHIAPHLTGTNKSKRRNSCGPKLQVAAEDSVNQTPDSPSTSNGKKVKKRKSMWDEPLQDGEYEIFIPKEEIVARKKRLSDANVSLSTTSTPKLKNPFASPVLGPKPNTPVSSSKKVNFVLQMNRSQGESEYFKTLRENPEIPYDANKEPPRGVLKPSPYSSPVNPFYKRKLHI